MKDKEHVPRKRSDSHHDTHKSGTDDHNKDDHHSPDAHHRQRKDSHHKAGGHDNFHKRKPDGSHTTHKGHHATGSPTTSSHPIRPRAGTLTHRDTAHSIVSSKGHHDKRSVATSDDNTQTPPFVKMENTYKLEPDVTFKQSPVKTIISDVIRTEFTSKKYDAGTMSKLCVLVSDMIKEKVKKQLDLPRFKIVCSVLVCEKAEIATSMVVTSRCLWDQRFDNYVTVTEQKGGYFVVVSVFAVYAE